MKIQSINPVNNEVIGEFEAYSQEMIFDVVAKARKSLKQWKNIDISEREKIIRNFANILMSRKKEVAELISKEMGKPIIEAIGEIEGEQGTFDWFLSETKNIIKGKDVKLSVDSATARIKFEPVGVVGLITPWNFPVGTLLWKIIPALLTGNTVVFKPSELSTFCGLKMAELLKEAGLPEGVFNVVTGGGETGRYLVLSKINMVSFTGSSVAGKNVASVAGSELKKVVLELGGSDSLIIFDDAIIDQAVNAALIGRFFNCGQVCTSAKRIFVDKKIYDSFLEKFTEKVMALRVGDPQKMTTEIGPMVSKKQLENLDIQVKDAINKGAKVMCGGKKIEGKGNFYKPTVLTKITADMLVMKEEVFGPVACIFSFDSIKEVIEMANNTKYGLGTSVWTEDNKKAEMVADEIESGMVWINEFGTPYPQCPMGGIKESGMGRELSEYGVLEFCNTKVIMKSQDKTIKKSWWFPYF